MNKLLVCLLLLGSLAAADLIAPAAATAAPAQAAPLQLTLSNKDGGGATNTFAAAADAQLFLRYEGSALTKGDKIKAVWIIDESKGVTPHAKVSEFTLAADGPKGKGTFHLARPAAGWPLGKWHVEVFVNEARIASVPFTIK